MKWRNEKSVWKQSKPSIMRRLKAFHVTPLCLFIHIDSAFFHPAFCLLPSFSSEQTASLFSLSCNECAALLIKLIALTRLHRRWMLWNVEADRELISRAKQKIFSSSHIENRISHDDMMFSICMITYFKAIWGPTLALLWSSDDNVNDLAKAQIR